MQALPEEMRGDQTLARIKAKDAGDALAKISQSYLTTRRMVNEGSLPLPKTDDDRAKIFEALGRPKTAGDYSFKLDAAKLPQGLNPQPAMLTAWQERAHKMGLSDAQFNGAMEAYWEDMSGFVEGLREARQQEFDDGMAALQKDWGGAHDTNMKVAKAAIAKFGGAEFVDLLDVTGLGNHPALLKAFYQAGQQTLSRDELDGFTKPQGGMTTDEIDARIAELQNNRALTTKGHPEHATVMQELRRLRALKFGEG